MRSKTEVPVKKRRTQVLRVCASCEWIFKVTEHEMCPKCGFGSYGARYVYGDKAYRYAKTQKPWKDKKLRRYKIELDEQITNSVEPTK